MAHGLPPKFWPLLYAALGCAVTWGAKPQPTKKACNYGFQAFGGNTGQEKANLDWRAQKWNFIHTDRSFTEPDRIELLEPDGKTLSVYNNAYLTMVINTACNAKCGFCIQELKQRRPDGGVSNPSTSSSLSPRDYAQRVKTVLQFTKPVDPNISISGGEPTISSRLPSVLEQIRQNPTPKLVIHTNGTRLLDPAPGEGFMEKPPQNRWTVLDHLLEANLNHINMSVAHFDRETNAAVMRMKPHDHDSLERAIEQAVKRGVRPRFSLVLLKEGIHDLKGLKDYLDWARNLGVDDIWIRELSAYDPTTTVFDHTAEYIDRERVKIDSILNEIDQDPDFRLVLQKSTTNSYRESYRFREVDIGFTDYRVIPPLVSLSGQPAPGNSSDKVKVFVLHPNGSLNAAWQEWERIIIPAPKPQ